MARISPIIVGALLVCAASPIGAGERALRARSHRFAGGFYPLLAWRVLRLERDVSRVIDRSGLKGRLRQKAIRALTQMTQEAWFSSRGAPVRLTLGRAGRGIHGARLVLERGGDRSTLTIGDHELRTTTRFQDSGFTKEVVYRGVGRDRSQGYLQLEVVDRGEDDRPRESAALLDAEGTRVQLLPPTRLDQLDALARHFDRPQAWPAFVRGATTSGTTSPR